MDLRARAGTFCQWRTNLQTSDAEIVRLLDDGALKLALLANAYDSSFSTCWPLGSRLLLDLFVDAWRGTSGPVRGRLLAAFADAGRRFCEQAPPLVASDPDWSDDPPGATLMAVVVEGATAHAAWIGADLAVLARGAEAVWQTTPHTLVERFRREHPDLADRSAVPNLIVRTIGPGATEAEPPDYLNTALAADDTLILLSRAASRGPCVSAEAAAAAAACTAEPSVLATRLADVALCDTDSPYVAVVAIRMDAAS